VAKSYYAHHEYMTPKIFKRYFWFGGRKKKSQVSARFGVSRRYRTNAAEPVLLTPKALAGFRAAGGSGFDDLAAAPRIEPERIVIGLGGERGAGRVRANFAYFPGWIYRIDGGRWREAIDENGLLAGDVDQGAVQVEFRYSWRTPARRWGLALSAVSIASLMMVGAWNFRRRRLTS